MCTARLFLQGGRPLCTQVLPGQGRPPLTILSIRKLDTGLPNGEYRIPLHSLVLTQYRNVTGGQTDGRRICRSIYSTCKASYAARCKHNLCL